MEICRDARTVRRLVHSGEAMKLHDQVTGVATRADLVAFIEALRADLQSNPQEWENATLDQYLRALASWLEDCSGYYARTGQGVPATPSWKNVAEMLIAAKIYE
jgi:hypothetical protein